MSQDHIRYREIPLQVCAPGCPREDKEILKIIFFKNEQRLRSHAVKHLLNSEESSWRCIISFDDKLISRCKSELSDIECPFMDQLGHEDPPCKQCRRFDRCSEITTEIEKVYVDIVEETIRQGGDIPRYACFFSKKTNTHAFWTAPNHTIIAKASLHGNIYNMMTCYDPSGALSVRENCELQRKRLLSEAADKSILWCSEAKWNPFVSRKKKGKKSHSKHQKKTRRYYVRGGSSNFRKYLEDFDV